MNKIKFSKEFLRNELDLPYGAIEDNITDTSRWSIHHTIIFEHEGKYYRTHYSEGATEMQDERPWEYDNEVECTEVHQVEKVVKVWEAV
ncbi:MAG: hypothetical protein PHT02_00650 [Tissierellia bacterium]|nr:hypothetical protein [Tissierellia bacterium]